MPCTIFVPAADHIDKAANLTIDEFLRKLRSHISVVIKAFLWMTLVFMVIIAIGFFLVSQLAVGFVALFQKSDPEQAQPIIELLPPSRQKQYPQCDLAQCPAQEKHLLIPISEAQVVEAIEKRFYCQQEAQTLGQWVIAQLPLPVPSSSTLQRTKSLNNALALQMIGWEAYAQVAHALKLTGLKQISSPNKAQTSFIS